MPAGYAELHCKSFYSFGQGASHVHELLSQASEYGYPALALPSGFSSELGLPLSAQIVGAPFAEALLVRAGHAYQQVTDWHLRVPPEDVPGGADD